jgi:hypothetical protein
MDECAAAMAGLPRLHRPRRLDISVAIGVYEGVVHGTCGVFQIFVFRRFLQLEQEALNGRVAQRESTTLTS